MKNEKPKKKKKARKPIKKQFQKRENVKMFK